MLGKPWTDKETLIVRRIARNGGSFDDAAAALGDGENRDSVRLKSRTRQIIFAHKASAHHGTSRLCTSKGPGR